MTSPEPEAVAGPAAVARPTDAVRARLLEFVSPGIVHGLGNAVFSIQGHGRQLGAGGGDLATPRQAILGAAERAQRTLDYYRVVIGVRGWVRGQAGILLRQAADVLRVPLRENGLSLELRHTARSTPVFVDAWDLYWPVSWAAASLLEEVPVGFDGVLALDLLQQNGTGVTLRVALEPHSALLPFPVPVSLLCAELSRWAGSAGVSVEACAGGVEIRIRATVQ